MSKSRTQRRVSRRLGVEQMESRLLLAVDGVGPVIDSSFLNHDGHTDYAMIETDASPAAIPSVTQLFTNGAGYTASQGRGLDVGGPLNSQQYLNNFASNTHTIALADSLSIYGVNRAGASSFIDGQSLVNYSLPGRGVVVTLISDGSNGDSLGFDSGANSIGSLIRPVRGLSELSLGLAGAADGAGVHTAGDGSLRNYSFNIGASFESFFNGSSAATPQFGDSETKSVGLESETDNVSEHALALANAIGQPASLNPDADSGATITATAPHVEIAGATEGGMIAIGRVMAELRGDTSLALVAGYATANSHVSDVSAAEVSGELARAVAFERIEGASDEVATFPVALALRDEQARLAAAESRPVAEANDAVYRPELVTDAAGRIRLAAYMATRGERVDGRLLDMPVAEWSGQGAALDADAAVDEARHEVFSRWENSGGEPSRLASLADRALSWPVAGAVAAAALGHIATHKRARRDRGSAPRPRLD